MSVPLYAGWNLGWVSTRVFLELEPAIRACGGLSRQPNEILSKLDVAVWRHRLTEVFMSLWILDPAQRSTFHIGLAASSFEPHLVVEMAVLSRKSRPNLRVRTRAVQLQSLITPHQP